MITNEERKRNADIILYNMGLLERLGEIGTPHIIGSYKMDMMAWNDLDIDVENQDMSLERLYGLTEYILRTFRPSWYEAKEEITDDGRRVWFHGAEMIVNGELWNLDVWFFDHETIHKAERYCEGIMEQAGRLPGARESIMRIKQGLQDRNLYGYGEGKYVSMDVYRAVLEQGVTEAEGMLERYVPGENRL